MADIQEDHAAPIVPGVPQTIHVTDACKGKCKLVVDTRERNVLRHAADLEGMLMEIKQITVGDYAVYAPNDAVLAIIERKSLEDYAASIKDGRVDNTEKLLDLRGETGCRVLYIVEGPLDAKPSDIFGGIAYKNIESHMFHLMIRDQIVVIRTKNTVDTAQTLRRFVDSMQTLLAKHAIQYHGAAPVEELQPAPADALERRHTKPTSEVMRTIWAVIPGISAVSADEYFGWSIADLVKNNIARAEIAAKKSATGRSISKKLVTTLCSLHESTPTNVRLYERMLACVPGISDKVAKELLVGRTMQELLNMSDADIYGLRVGKAKKMLGERAKQLTHFMNYKLQPILVADV